jgi:two-component system nitrate/nitrite response regulator NarL
MMQSTSTRLASRIEVPGEVIDRWIQPSPASGCRTPCWSQTQKISDYTGDSGAEVARETMRQRSFETVLVGSNTLAREGLKRILRAANFDIVASASCIDDADLSSLALQKPTLLIIDSGDASEAAIEQVRASKKQYPAARVAMLADHYRIHHIVSAFEAGTDAYFVSVANWHTFIKSLELVMLGETFLPSALLPYILNHDGRRTSEQIAHDFAETRQALRKTEYDATSHLSVREKGILNYLVEGYSNKTIARKIDIAEATVKVHVKAILRKIRVQNRTQAAIWAINNGSFIGSSVNDWSDAASLVLASAHLSQGVPIHTEISTSEPTPLLASAK